MPIVSTVFGNTTGTPGTTTYTISNVTAGNTIRSSDFTALATSINAEVVRRNHGSPGAAAPGVVTITAAYLNAGGTLITGQTGRAVATNTNPGTVDAQPQIDPAVAFVGYTNTGLFNGVTAGNTITAANVNGLIALVKAAGAQCLCNCNYCTCNCNYCTCNCNYACTCNCNYSDVRLKENITFIETKDGINIYSWNYIKNAAQRYIGVMAQELLGTKYEKAVILGTDGFYMVSYGMLPVKMTEV